VVLTAAQPSARVDVNVIGDTTPEASLEFFQLSVILPITGAPIMGGAQGLIEDDDGLTPPPQGAHVVPFDAFAIEPVTGQSEARIGLRLMRPQNTPVTVNYVVDAASTATAGSDYTGAETGSVTFAAGETLKQIVFNVLADNLSESREFVRLNLSTADGVTLARRTATLTITERGNVTPSASAAIIPCRPFVREDAGDAILLVKRIGSTEAALSVAYRTEDGSAVAGSDYTNTSGNLSWVAGNAEIKRILVPILTDDAVEPAEMFRVKLDTANANAPLSQARVVILDSVDEIQSDDFSELCTSDTTSESAEFDQAL
jgi:Calx-beta domain